MSMEHCWCNTDGGNPSIRSKTCQSDTLSKTIPTWMNWEKSLGSNLDLRKVDDRLTS